MTKSVCIAIPKKTGTTDCENHRTNSFVSHVTELALRVILSRWKQKIRSEVLNVQCGFFEV